MAPTESEPGRRDAIIEVQTGPEPPHVPLDHPAFGARAKLQQAFNHMRQLHGVTAAIAKHTNVKVKIADNPETGWREWTLYDVNVPSTVDAGLMAGDVIHNLRSALDHLMWQLVLANNGTPGKLTSFPIAENAKRYRDIREQRLAGASPDATRRIDALEPYGGGAGAALWEVHELDIQDKHKLLLPTVSAATALILDGTAGFPPEARAMLGETAFELVINNGDMIPAEDGAVVLRSTLGDATADDTRIRIEPTLGGAPLGDRLAGCIAAVCATYIALVDLLD